MMNKDDRMVFFYRQGHETTTVSISAQSSLVEAVEAFERFLRGAGYYFDEKLDFVPQEEDRLGSAYEEDENPIVFGSNDWDSSMIFGSNAGAAEPTLTVSDSIDLTEINLDLSSDISLTATEHSQYYYDFDRNGRLSGSVDQIPGLESNAWVSFTTEDLDKFKAR